MAERASIGISKLNVTNQLNSAEVYTKAFDMAFDLKLQIPLGGDRYAILTSLKQDISGNLIGVFARYTQINMGQDWFNINELRPATTSETKEIQIPDVLRPNYTPVSFAFVTLGHALFFEAKSAQAAISAKACKRFFETLLNTKAISDLYGPFNVEIVAEHGSAIELISKPGIVRLDIRFVRPNPDGWGRDYLAVAEQMAEIGANEASQSFIAKGNNTIQRNALLDSQAEIAEEHGEVSIRRRVEGSNTTVTESTSEKPIMYFKFYNFRVESPYVAFVNWVRENFPSLLRKEN